MPARMRTPTGVRFRDSERELIMRAADKQETSMSELIRRAAVARARRILSDTPNANREGAAM